jgi:hypothetical protein
VKQIDELSVIVPLKYAGPEAEGQGGMDNRIFLGTIAQRGKFAGRHDTGRKIRGLAAI